MIEYRITKGKLILNKDETYLGLTASQIDEILDIFMSRDVIELVRTSVRQNTVIGARSGMSEPRK